MIAIHRQQGHRAAERGIANEPRRGLYGAVDGPRPDAGHAGGIAPGAEEELGGGDIRVNSPDPVILIGAGDGSAVGPRSVADHQIIISGYKELIRAEAAAPPDR